MPTLQADSTIGGYQLIKLLGEGGMGEVWLGQDRLADRRVALKFIKPHLLDDPGFRARFSNEAKTLGKLEHDRIVTLYTVLDEGDYLALVLRFIDGNSLADRIDLQGGPLPLDFVVSCARDILPALGFAHDHGIIHRDIKPPNILVDSRDRSFLMDFGIAVAAFAERGTMTGFAIGTPHYMSPEQIRTPRDITPESGGHRTDIYSFGVVLFEMLSGRVPFGQHSGVEDMYAIQHAHCNDAPPRLCDINPHVAPALEEVVLSCLAKDPNDRPQTCIELLAQFESAALSGATHPVRSYPKTIVEPRSSPVRQLGAVPIDPIVVPPTPIQVRRKMPQTVWYGLGAVVIAAGVTVTVMEMHNGTTKTAEPSKTVVQQQQPQQDPPKKPSQQQKPQSDGRIARNDPGKQPVQTIVVMQPPPQPQKQVDVVPQPPPGPTPDQIEAEKDFQAGKSLFEQGQYCESKAKIDEAISLNPKPQYSKLLKSAANGCNSQ